MATTASKCPFTGMINDAYEQSKSELKWSKEAEERINRIPSFAQIMVRKSIEQHAREKGYDTVDLQLLEEVRGIMGM